MRVVPVRVLSDNYAYLLIDKSGEAAAVDPAEPDTIINAAKLENARITTVLTTHKHWDHAGGNEAISSKIPGLQIVGGSTDKVEACTKAVNHGEDLSLGDIKIKCLHTPFHTTGHITYVCSYGGEQVAFTGDTLFVAGCGRFFEGTAAQAHHSLTEVLSKLPPQTKVYCGHEYTVKNLQFAASVEPQNQAVQDKLEWAQAQVAKGLPTIPSTIGDELTFNPFLRCDQPGVQAFASKGSNPVDVLGEVRRCKDSF